MKELLNWRFKGCPLIDYNPLPSVPIWHILLFVQPIHTRPIDDLWSEN